LLNGDAELLIRIGSSDPCSLDEHLYQQLGLLSRTSLKHHLNLFMQNVHVTIRKAAMLMVRMFRARCIQRK